MRRPPAEEVECEDVEAKGYPRSGLSQYSRSVGHHQWDWRLAKMNSDAEGRAVWRLQAMGARAYADWLVNRKSTCPPPPNEQPAQPAPYKPRRYRKRLEAMDEIVRVQTRHKPKPRLLKEAA
jgi:hypothetical protein